MKIVPLGSVADIEMGQAPAGQTYNDDGLGLPLLAGASDLGELFPQPSRYTSEPGKKSRAGDIILCIRATIGDLNWADREYCLGRGVAGLRARSERIDPKYLWWAIQNGRIELASRGRGATFKQVNRKDIETLPIPLPPLKEQRQIAAILDLADVLRKKRLESLACAEKLEERIFADALRGNGIDAWPVVRVGELCTVKGGKRLPKGDDYSPLPTPYRYIRVSDIWRGEVDEPKLRFLKPETQRQISRYTVAEGDVIISIAGTIGAVAVVTPSLAGANLTENAAKLCPADPNRYVPSFIAKVLQQPAAQKQIAAKTGQVTIGKLALFRIEQIEIQLPPVELQRVIVETMGHLRKQRALNTQHLADLDVLFASLQHRAFNGELTRSDAKVLEPA